MASPKKGIKISTYGFSPETEKYKECGSGSNKNLLPLPI